MLSGWGGCGLHAKQHPTASEFLLAVAIAHETEVADTVKSWRQDMDQKAADELIARQRHGLDLVGMTIVAPLEGHRCVVDVEETMIGDGHPMGISAKVIEHLLRSGKRRLGVDHPLLFA